MNTLLYLGATVLAVPVAAVLCLGVAAVLRRLGVGTDAAAATLTAADLRWLAGQSAPREE